MIEISMRYAKAKSGKTHLAFEYGGKALPRSLCGREPVGGWRMTSNVPGGADVCKQCQAAAQKKGDALRLEFAEHLIGALFGRHVGWAARQTIKDYLHICELYNALAKK